MTIEWSKPVLAQAIACSVFSLLFGIGFAIAGNHFLNGLVGHLWFFMMLFFGILFPLLLLPIFQNRTLHLRADLESIELTSPHLFYGPSFSVETAKVEKIQHRRGDEGDHLVFLILKDGSEILLPQVKGFPVASLTKLIRTSNA